MSGHDILYVFSFSSRGEIKGVLVSEFSRMVHSLLYYTLIGHPLLVN